MVIADTEKAAEGEHGVRHLAALLVDHDALDRADLVVIGAIDRSSFDLVAADQVTSFVCFQCHRSSSRCEMKENEREGEVFLKERPRIDAA